MGMGYPWVACGFGSFRGHKRHAHQCCRGSLALSARRLRRFGGSTTLVEYVGPIWHNETEGLSGRGLQKSVPSECDRQLWGQDQLSSSWLSDIHQLVFVDIMDIPELCRMGEVEAYKAAKMTVPKRTLNGLCGQSAWPRTCSYWVAQQSDCQGMIVGSFGGMRCLWLSKPTRSPRA